MNLRLLLFCAAGFLLAGCAADQGDNVAADVTGYRYHDANHPDGVSQTSPAAAYNATHGTWLWPPAQSDRPN
jgi:hypothetical protein